MKVAHFAQLDKDTLLLCAESESATFLILYLLAFHRTHAILTFIHWLLQIAFEKVK